MHARHRTIPTRTTRHAHSTAALGLCAVLALLAGCAAPGQTATPDLRTASDQTDADRRARVRLDLATAYFSRGQYPIALDEVKQALAARPDLAEAHNLRGLVYAALGEEKLAEESFQRALQLAPRNGDTLHNHGWFLCQQRRWPEALAQFDKAMAQPTYRDAPRTLLAMGVCQARSGDMAGAERSLQQSYQMDGGNPITAYNLADVLYRRADFDRARALVRRLNQQPELSSAQTLWLAARIEHKTGNRAAAQSLGRELGQRFPRSPEALAFEGGRFDD